MTDLYSYKGAFPYPLPQDMSHYDIKDFYLAPPAPALPPGYVLGWNVTEWTVRSPNDSELQIQWAAIRERRNALLAQSDIFVVRAYERGEPVSVETVAYRQALRDVTTQPDPFAIDWPVPPPNPF